MCKEELNNLNQEEEVKVAEKVEVMENTRDERSFYLNYTKFHLEVI